MVLIQVPCNDGSVWQWLGRLTFDSEGALMTNAVPAVTDTNQDPLTNEEDYDSSASFFIGRSKGEMRREFYPNCVIDDVEFWEADVTTLRKFGHLGNNEEEEEEEEEYRRGNRFKGRKKDGGGKKKDQKHGGNGGGVDRGGPKTGDEETGGKEGEGGWKKTEYYKTNDDEDDNGHDYAYSGYGGGPFSSKPSFNFPCNTPHPNL